MARLGRGQPQPVIISRAPQVTVQISSEIGNGAAAASTTAVERKIAAQRGICGVAPVGVAAEKKVAVSTGPAAAATATTGLESSVAAAGVPARPVISRTALAVAVARYEAQPSWFIDFGPVTTLELFAVAGRTASAATATSVERKVAVQCGTCAGAPTGAVVHSAAVAEVPRPTRTTVVGTASQTALFFASLGQGKPKRAFISRAAVEWTPPSGTPEQGIATSAVAATSIDRKVAAETGSSPAAVVSTAVDKKVAAQRGICALAPAGTGLQAVVAGPTSRPTQTTIVGTASPTALYRATLGQGVPKRAFVTRAGVEWTPPAGNPEQGSATSAVTAVSTDKKIAVQTGICAVSPANTSVHGVVAPAVHLSRPVIFDTAVDVAIRRYTALSYPLIDLGPPLVQQANAELGTGAAAVTATAVERKVAVQRGSCGVAATGSGAAKKVTAQRGTSTAAVMGTAVAGTTQIVAERGHSTAAPATLSAEKKVAVQTGSCTIGSAASSVARKVMASRGTSTVGACSLGAAGKIAASRGTCAAAAVAVRSGLVARTQTGLCAAAPIGRVVNRKTGIETANCAAATTSRGTTSKRVGSRGVATAAAGPWSTVVERFSFGRGAASHGNAQTGGAARGSSASGKAGVTQAGSGQAGRG